jgi:hypothetical protein
MMRMRFVAATWLVVAGSAVVCRSLPADPDASASKQCSSPEYRRLDFWAGDWDVFDVGGSGRPIAHARVDVILDGCALREVYEQTDGLTGQSFTIYDAPRKTWHQSWVTNRGQLLTIEGDFHGGSLTLQGRQFSSDAREKIVRGVWKPEGEGVRETAHTSDDGGATWRLLFDIRFQRRKARAGLSKSPLGALVEAGLLLRGRDSPAIVQRYMAA